MFRVTESTAPNKAVQPPEEGRWTRGLFECCVSIEEADEEGCEWVMVFPSVLHARMATWLRGDSYRLSCCTYFACWAYCAWWFASPVRSELRRKYTLPEEPCSDCMTHLCCSPCAVWQEYRELEAREGIHFYLQPQAGGSKKEQPQKQQEQEQQPAHQAWQPLETEQQPHQPQQSQQQQLQVTALDQLPEAAHHRELQPSASRKSPPQERSSRPSPIPGSFRRKLDPADSYRKRSAEIEADERAERAAALAMK